MSGPQTACEHNLPEPAAPALNKRTDLAPRAAPARAMLGIDFGTSNSAAAIVQPGQPGEPKTSVRPIVLEGSATALPTALFFSQEDQCTFYGAEAMRHYLAGTEGRLMRSIKSLLGSALMDEQTQVNGRMVGLFDVLVMFLRELKIRAEEQLDYRIDAAMLGRPVHFVDDNPARDALAQQTLEQAARAAGFTTVNFQLEPIAAAFDFEQQVAHDTVVLVVDVGGGTSDFTVVRTGPGRAMGADRSTDILATTGVHIGGTDFDRLLDLHTVMPLLGLGHHGPGGREVPSPLYFDLSTWHLIQQCYGRASLHRAHALRTAFTNPGLHHRLMRVLQEKQGHRLLNAVELAKIACSQSGLEQQIDLTCAEPALGAPLTAAAMNAVLSDTLQKVVACARDCVAGSGEATPDVIYLTGGSSLLKPLVQGLQVAFPHARLAAGDRFGSVAAGLALAGAAFMAGGRMQDKS